MKLYVKCLTIDANHRLVSCNGGVQVWGDYKVHPADGEFALCQAGALHVCRMRDVPAWISTHQVIVQVESDDILTGQNKVGVRDARIIRTAPDVDGLDLLVRFAEFCAEKGADYTDAAATAWIVQQYPAGFFDGVEA